MPDNELGRLKIFLSFAEGVGKTYAMLDEAHRRQKRGQEVVIGFVNDRGRPATKEQAKGFEVIPPLTVNGKPELDVDAVIKRRPEVVLIDQLAHSNGPGMKYAKRWEDVQAILNAGISVLSTMDVYHLESLNDQIEDITGVHIEETVPDQILHQAEEIEMVDLTVRALLNRLDRGDVFPTDDVDPNTAKLYNETNLAALREIALREAAGRVDEDVLELRREKSIKKPWQTQEKMMICVGSSNPSMRLLRRGWRIAQRIHADVVAVFVEEGKLNEKQEKIVSDDIKLAERLGIKVVKLKGQPAEVLIKYARENDITQIMIGHSNKSRFESMVREPISTSLARELRTIDIHIVAAEQPASSH
ncbi:MAG TPA: universal stress protein [Fimbriimonadaceae bacterium]|nr:universal stress protein [Fimbriimonadaceae bacterium]